MNHHLLEYRPGLGAQGGNGLSSADRCGIHLDGGRRRGLAIERLGGDRAPARARSCDVSS